LVGLRADRSAARLAECWAELTAAHLAGHWADWRAMKRAVTLAQM